MVRGQQEARSACAVRRRHYRPGVACRPSDEARFRATLRPRGKVRHPGRSPRVIHVEEDKKRSKTVKLGWLKKEDVGARLKQALAGGGCAAVIRNTVGLAQETYLELRQAFLSEIESGDLELHLFHARFPF